MAAFVGRRFFSTAFRLSNLKPSLATPAPVEGTAALTTPELKALATKAQDHWSKLTKEETVMLYRASFPMTMAEIGRNIGGDGLKVLFGVVTGLLVAGGLFAFLQTNVGPERPHTVNNPQWEEDTRKKLIRQKANPIEGISSRV